MAILPLVENTRIEITIKSWALKATDGSSFNKDIHGIWFTKLSPLYSHPHLVETLAGALVANLPSCIVKLAIYEASRWADTITSPTCPNPDQEYFEDIRRRYVTLKSLLNIISETQGLGSVTKKVLGDFEITFDNSSGDNNLLSRTLDELDRLEPIIQSGGCLGLDTSFGPKGMVKGVTDPYRPIISRLWDTPRQTESGQVNGIYSPGFNRGTQYPNRWRRASYGRTRFHRRGK